MDLLRSVPNALLANRLEEELGALQVRLDNGEFKSSIDALAALYEVLGSYIVNFGHRQATSLKLDPNDFPDSGKFASMLRHIETDFKTTRSLIAAYDNYINGMFNRELDRRTSLLHAVGTLQKLSHDLAIAQSLTEPNTYIFGDDFVDNSKIDYDFPIDANLAVVDMVQGALTLGHIAAQSIDLSSANVRIIRINKQRLPTDDKTRINEEPVNFFYEGRYYGYPDQVIPEGGRFDFELMDAGSYLNGHPVQGADFYSQIHSPGALSGVGSTSKSGTILDLGDNNAAYIEPSNLVVLRNPANEEILADARKQILDGSIGTFWECEYVFALPQHIVVTPFDASALGSPSSREEGFAKEDLRKEMTAEQENTLRNSISNVEPLEIDLLIDLGTVKDVNKLQFIPYNSFAHSNIQILSVAISDTSSGQFIPLSYENMQAFKKSLVSDYQADVDDLHESASSAPDNYEYRGLVSWSFPATRCRFIKITIRQRSAMLCPYRRVVFELVRTMQYSSQTQMNLASENNND